MVSSDIMRIWNLLKSKLHFVYNFGQLLHLSLFSPRGGAAGYRYNFEKLGSRV